MTMLASKKHSRTKKTTSFTLVVLASFLLSTSSAQVTMSLKTKRNFGEVALKESTVPIHPGEPGKTPFWNMHARQFMYAPAFNYKVVKNATKYRYKIISTIDNTARSFENTVPFAALSPVWASVPVGLFNLQVIGLSDAGDSLGIAGKGEYLSCSNI